MLHCNPFSPTQWNEWSGCWLAGHLEGRREEHARSRWLARCNGSRQPWPASPACRCYLSASSLLVVDNDDYYTVVELPTRILTRRNKSSWSNGPIQQLDAHRFPNLRNHTSLPMEAFSSVTKRSATKSQILYSCCVTWPSIIAGRWYFTRRPSGGKPSN